MPGRQRSMVSKVAAVEEKAQRLGDAFYGIVPKLYLQRAEKQLSGLSPINIAWCDAMAAIATAYRSIKQLRRLLEERANALPEPEPCPHVPLPKPPCITAGLGASI